MGLFGNLFGNKSKDEFTLGKTPEWFTSPAGENHFLKLRNKDKDFLSRLNKLKVRSMSFEEHLEIFFYAYLTSLPNIIEIEQKSKEGKLHARGSVWLTSAVSRIFVSLSYEEDEDDFGEKHLAYEQLTDILTSNPEKNPYLYYTKHVSFGMGLNTMKKVLTAIIENRVDVVTDTWLYDPAIFDHANDQVVCDRFDAKLFERVGL